MAKSKRKKKGGTTSIGPARSKPASNLIVFSSEEKVSPPTLQNIESISVKSGRPERTIVRKPGKGEYIQIQGELLADRKTSVVTVKIGEQVLSSIKIPRQGEAKEILRISGSVIQVVGDAPTKFPASKEFGMSGVTIHGTSSKTKFSKSRSASKKK